MPTTDVESHSRRAVRASLDQGETLLPYCWQSPAIIGTSSADFQVTLGKMVGEVAACSGKYHVERSQPEGCWQPVGALQPKRHCIIRCPRAKLGSWRLPSGWFSLGQGLPGQCLGTSCQPSLFLLPQCPLCHTGLYQC